LESLSVSFPVQFCQFPSTPSFAPSSSADMIDWRCVVTSLGREG
jgi:hypothetical protein